MIPKEQLTAWQRWELASFDSKPPTAHATQQSLPTVGELDDLREQGRREGYAAGRDEGYQAGLLEGQRDGQEQGIQAAQAHSQQEQAPLMAQLNQLVLNFDAELAQADKTVASDIVTFATDLAAAMLKTALVIKPELLIPLIQQALTSLPSVQRNGKIYLHPNDAALVRQHLHEDVTQHAWQIIEDSQIAAGGCRIETHSNQIDASLATRWQRLMLAIGQQPEWLDT